MHDVSSDEPRGFCIWVDADACPVAIREILFRAAERARVRVTLVANQALRLPSSAYVESVRVASGFDVADRYIVEQVQPGDLVVTADIPLAASVIERGARALTPRGERFTVENIHERLAVRDLMEDLRSSGLAAGGPAALSAKERQAFANQLDRILTAARARS